MGRDLSFLIPELTLAITAMLMLVAEMLRLPRITLVLGLAGLTAATLLTLPVLSADTTVFGYVKWLGKTYTVAGHRIDVTAGAQRTGWTRSRRQRVFPAVFGHAWCIDAGGWWRHDVAGAGRGVDGSWLIRTGYISTRRCRDRSRHEIFGIWIGHWRGDDIRAQFLVWRRRFNTLLGT